jgi:hypothetical protein
MTGRVWGVLLALLFIVSVYHAGRMDGIESERMKYNDLANKERIEHAKKLSEATNSIVAASREYDSVKSERDALAERLRKQLRAGGKTNSSGTCEARVARMEKLVEQLHGLVERCDAGWHGCASRKDALVKAVK